MTRTQKLVQAAKQAREQANVKGRSAAKIKVTSTGTPPLTGAEAFARLLVAKVEKKMLS